jgi:hypothetical protein
MRQVAALWCPDIARCRPVGARVADAVFLDWIAPAVCVRARAHTHVPALPARGRAQGAACDGGVGTGREVRSTHWSILDRMRLVNENIKAVAESPDGLAWLYTLLRFNAIKLVPLSRNSNYQSKDLAHTQDGVSRGLAALYGRSGPGALWVRTYTRLGLGAVPRGGGNGDAIRLEILDIMRRHGIKEGHRPGIEDRFLEDWSRPASPNCLRSDPAPSHATLPRSVPARPLCRGALPIPPRPASRHLSPARTCHSLSWRGGRPALVSSLSAAAVIAAMERRQTCRRRPRCTSSVRTARLPCHLA